MTSIKYTKELLQEACNASESFAGVLRYLGLKQSGGTHTYISSRIREFELDITHFTGKKHNKGKPSPTRLTADQVLVLRPEGSRRENVKRLRRVMLETGMNHVCDKCNNTGWWQGKKLVLEMDHIDGNWLNNRIENLRFLCPNCHTQEPTNTSWKNTEKIPHKKEITQIEIKIEKFPFPPNPQLVFVVAERKSVYPQKIVNPALEKTRALELTGPLIYS